jgi:uncharacterized protein YecE (DUF72 family)
MRVLAGTSGWSFKEWKGAFYPKGLADDAMLAHYASRFPAVEVNNTFYRMPKEKVMLEWADQVPPNFRFAIKASQRITHKSRLADAGSDLEYFMRVCSALGDRRGPSLFQLPPNMKKDLPRLEAFLQLIPRRWQATFEFRHPTWFDDSVYQALRAHDCALCLAEQDDFETPTVATADWGYVRLHRTAYDQPALAAQAARIRAQPWQEAFVFFKHDGDQSGPAAVEQFLAELQGAGRET